MLVKPTVVELLNKAENRYRLVVATAKRARQISQGSIPMTEEDDISPVSLAADEIEEGKLEIFNEKQWESFKTEQEKTNSENNSNNDAVENVEKIDTDDSEGKVENKEDSEKKISKKSDKEDTSNGATVNKEDKISGKTKKTSKKTSKKVSKKLDNE